LAGAEVPADGVEIGTCLLVRPGEKIAIDGKVTKGSSNVDQMLLTGESRPVRKIPGQEVGIQHLA
jgi:P-type E1-E2 ATPase